MQMTSDSNHVSLRRVYFSIVIAKSLYYYNISSLVIVSASCVRAVSPAAPLINMER